MKKRLLTLVLAILLLLTAVSCANNGGTETETSASTLPAGNTEESTLTETTEKVLDINIPDGTNYGNTEFKYLYDTRAQKDFTTETISGEAINDAIFNRNAAVEERLGIKFEWIGKNGTWDVKDHNNAIENSVKTGLHEFDAISGELSMLMIIITNGNFLNIKDMKYIDLTAPWWSGKAADTLTVNNKCFLAIGDSSLTLYKNTFCMYFNKTLAKDRNISDVYSTVKENNWTLDKLIELTKDIYIDVNGDSQAGLEDSYGYSTSYNNHMRNWQVALNTPICKIGDDGLMELCFYNDRTEEAYGKLYNLHSASSTIFKDTTIGSPDGSTVPTIFTDNRALFMSGYLSTASLLRTTDCDFGIIPYPKYDQAQENYRTTIHNSAEMICFPTTLTETDRSAIVSEALAYEGWKQVIPQYCEIILKYRNATDIQSAEMVELIMDSVLFDLGWCHSSSLNNVGITIENCIKNKVSTLSSYWTGTSKTVQKKLNDLNKAYQNIK